MGRQGKGAAGPAVPEVETKLNGYEAPSDFEGDSGVSLSEDVIGVEAASPLRKARPRKQKEVKEKPKPRGRSEKRKASPASEIEEDAGDQEDVEEDTQIVAVRKTTKKKSAAKDEDILWVGRAISKDLAKKFWPQRYGPKEELAEGRHLAVAHYEQCSVDGFLIGLGDCVSVQGDDIDYVAIVYELFESTKHDKMFHARWFWRVGDTVLRTVGAVKGGKIHDKMVLLSSWSNNDENDNPLDCVKGKLNVVYVPPEDVAAGTPIPDCDYWYNSCWAQSYNTIKHTLGPVTGVNPLLPITEESAAQVSGYTGKSPAAHVAGPLDSFVPTPPAPAPRALLESTKSGKAKKEDSTGLAVGARIEPQTATSEAGPSGKAGLSNTQADQRKDDTPSKVNVVGLEKRLSEPTPSKKTASLTALSGQATPGASKAKAKGAKESIAKSEVTPSTGSRSRGSARLSFKLSPKQGEVGSAEKPVALDSEDEQEAAITRPTRTTARAKRAVFITEEEAPGPSAAPVVTAAASKIGAAVKAAVEGAAAVTSSITVPEEMSVEVTATATVTATVVVPKKTVADAKADAGGPSNATKPAKLSDFLDGHKYPKAQEFLTVLDMYSGCGGMSTGLTMGLGKAGIHLEAKWAVDMMECACQTYKLNHPDTHVRNESAENFFMACIEWLRLKKIHVDGELDYKLPQELVDIIRSTYVPNYRLSADETPVAEPEDDKFEPVFVEEEVIDEELADEEGKKKRPKKKAAVKKAVESKPPPAKKNKTSKADPMTGRGGEPPKSEALQMFTHVVPSEAERVSEPERTAEAERTSEAEQTIEAERKGKGKVDEATAPEAGSPSKPIEVPDEETGAGKKRKRVEKTVVARETGGRRSARAKNDIDYSKETMIEVEDEPVRKKSKAPAKVASKAKGKKKLSEGDEEEVDEDVYEVEYVYGIRWHRDRETNFRGLQYRIRWKNYTEEWDTWEPEELTDGCPDLLKEFVQRGVQQRILPLPGTVGLICGGPPCQGASGFNRFRNKDEPLMDPRNKQVIIFMDIAKLLKPRYVLMENVVDILKFGDGILGRYAIRRLVNMGYQSRVGLLVAGSFGVPQFRMRTFVWGAAPGEVLPPYPLPTHMVEKVRNHVPVDWVHSMVAYDEATHEEANLDHPLVLGDALRDLPPVENAERRDVVPYTGSPDCEFQRQVRRPPPGKKMEASFLVVNDHHSLIMNEDDLARSSMIPKKKGANFRDLPGVITQDDKTVIRTARPLLASGKPIVPDYAITFIKGKSFKPFGRLWWDETVATVVTRAEPHNQRVLHPVQDRVLSIRENARLQGFPDYYKLTGIHPKNKYTLVGNAVAMPVAEALGKAMALAVFKDWDGSQPLCKVTPWTY